MNMELLLDFTEIGREYSANAVGIWLLAACGTLIFKGYPSITLDY